MQKSIVTILYVVLIACLFPSCHSPYIGRQVFLDQPTVCSVASFPAECMSDDSNFTFNYKVAKTNAPSVYGVDAIATYHGSLTWVFFNNAVFTLLLIKDGVVVETVATSIGRGYLGTDIHFQRSFSTHIQFDAVAITYDMAVSDSGRGFGFREKRDIVTGRISAMPPLR
jgi:hypothetical protein